MQVSFFLVSLQHIFIYVHHRIKSTKTMIKSSELVLAGDGSLYHIHLKDTTLADDIILVGDPGRVEMFKSIFESTEHESYNREMHALTGLYHGHRFTALSTGMGCDNIDIVVSELDAAANIDLVKREPKATHRQLNMVRIGTSGSLHSEIKVGDLVASKHTVGLDGLLNYYRHESSQLNEKLNEAFIKHMGFDACFARPYAVDAGKELFEKVSSGMHHGITATAPGFYAPQGRALRIEPSIEDLNEKLATFEWGGCKLTNLEMETSAIYGLASIMGHQALTVCLIIANRADGTFLNDYHKEMKDTIVKVMERLGA